MKFFEEDDNVELEFGFNKEYASRFEHNKKRQELEQLQAKYKNMSDSESDSSSSEEEDENGELITEEIDDQIALTLKFLRQKDEIVYTDKNFFDDQELAQIKKKEKPVYLKEYQQSILLGKRESPNKFENNEKIQLDVEVDDEELFTKRELEQSDQEVDDDQFLDNFLKKKQWIQTDEIQTYDQITHTLHDTTDEEEESDHENYETTHNFRFEEPNSNMVITHSRLISGAIRRKDNTRVLKRMTLKERKEQEKTKKQNELKRLKNLKKMELNEKLKEIHKMAGGDLKGLDSIDLEKEFDPNEHDRKMMGMFDQKYYQHCNDAVKPVFDDDIDILDLVDEEDTGEGGDYAEDYPAGYEKDYTGYEDKKSKKIVFDENMDADAEQQNPQYHIDKVMDEYYQLDFEDLIGSLPVRFKYKKVVPDSYTLTPEEILQAEDEDLNNVVSLKKLGPYRSNEQKAVDDLKWKKSKKRKLWEFRSKLKGGEGLKNNQIEESDIGVNAILKDAKIEGKRLDSYAATSTVKKAKSKKSKR